jgi:Bacterial Ig-like domain (group 2)
MRSALIALAAAGLILTACTDTDPTRPGTGLIATGAAPTNVISDAAHLGKPHFYFLRPMVGSPATTGVFDATLEPEVQVCVVDGSACEPTIAVFTTTTSWGSERVRVAPEDSAYIVNWHTNEFALDTAATYRIRVLVDGIELGYADLDVVGAGRELRNVNTNEYVPLLDGRTLPIRFRVEEGFLARITVTPEESTVAIGETQAFTATATDLHDAVLPDVAFTWSTSDGAVATLDAAGTATALAAGSAVITATAAGTEGTAQLTVYEPTPEPSLVGAALDGGWASAVVNDVNDAGIVVGYLNPAPGSGRARSGFRWNGTDPIEVLPLGGATTCEAWGIGNLGTIVGSCAIPGVGGRGVTWTGSDDPVPLPTPSALLMSSAGRDIYEDASVMRITGLVNRNYNYTCSFPPCTGVAPNAAVWTGTGVSTLAVTQQYGWDGNVNGASGVGLAINASGHTTGQRSVVVQYVCGFQCFNYIDVPRGYRAAPAVGGMGANYIPPNNLGRSAGLGINAFGDVVGWTDAVASCSSGTVCTARHAAQVWPAGGTRATIPGIPAVTVTASEARDINDLRWVVGGYGSNAFVWRQDGSAPALLDPLVAGKAAGAYAISNVNGSVLYAAGIATNADNKGVPVRWTLVAP